MCHFDIILESALRCGLIFLIGYTSLHNKISQINYTILNICTFNRSLQCNLHLQIIKQGFIMRNLYAILEW